MRKSACLLSHSSRVSVFRHHFLWLYCDGFLSLSFLVYFVTLCLDLCMMLPMAHFHFLGEGVFGLILLHCKAVLIFFSRPLCLEILLLPMSQLFYCFRKGHHLWVFLIRGCPLDIQPHVGLPDHVKGCQSPPLGTLLLGFHSACCQFPFLPVSLGPSVFSLLSPGFGQ